MASVLKLDVRRQSGASSAARAQRALVLDHTSLVRRIAYQIVRRLPRSVEVDDLIQEGMLGLIEASKRYAAGRAAAFETYASFRIRGAIMDSVRKAGWAPRSLHRRVREIARARCRIENETGKVTAAADIAAAVGVSLDEYHRTIQDSAVSQVLRLDAQDPDDAPNSNEPVDHRADPADVFEFQESRRAVAAAIDALPEREREILLLYYDEELLLREIGEKLDLSESRVCQIHQRAVARLRGVAERWMESLGSADELAAHRSAR
jgi:RNA polymerase sigma factor for flagellar operon FliA